MNLEVEFNDANYTWTDDPFGPEYEIVDFRIIHMGLACDPAMYKRYNTVITKDGLYFPEEKKCNCR
jgi:hypothetical protein